MKRRIIIIILTILLAVSLLLPSLMQEYIADTQTGFILASGGKDGQIGTGDDIVATNAEPAAAQKAANVSQADAVLSASAGIQQKALRQPNSDEIVIKTGEDLAKIGVDPKYPLSGKYILMSDIDLSGYTNWNPIGSSSTPFTGQFDGNGFVIKNLTISRSGVSYQGLFGYIGSTGKVMNLTLENASVSGYSYVGSLAGANLGTITKVYSTCSVKANQIGNVAPTGGLVGYNKGTIADAHTFGSVSGYNNTGGLTGRQEDGTITDSSSACNVTGAYSTGGLAGENYNGLIKRSYATGNVISNWGHSAGGLVGDNTFGTIEDSYATGNVTNNTYYSYIGGLVGNHNSGTIKNSYSTGKVSGSTYTGGLVGYNAGSIINSYWDAQTSGYGTGKTTVQMKQRATFTGWDFTNTWAIDEGKSYPYLRTNEQKPHPGVNQ